MTKQLCERRTRRAGAALLIELTIAVGILAVVLGSFAASFGLEQRLLKGCYFRAVAMEIVDGEMEALAAGDWKAYGEGSHAYEPRADSAKGLPDGQFLLTVGEERLRLEWIPAQPGKGSRVVREVRLR